MASVLQASARMVKMAVMNFMIERIDEDLMICVGTMSFVFL